MIKGIVAIDDKYGLADETGIPWVLPSDKAYFRQQTAGSSVLMGYQTYLEFPSALPNRVNLVLSRPNSQLRDGFTAVEDFALLKDEFMSQSKDLWVIGGAKLFAKLLTSIDELYVTRVSGDFNCNRFFPNFEDKFEMVSRQPSQTENGISFHFEVWHKR